ncbi:MAG: helix-turn-helix domain-containing protein [Candidatus Limnocylindria bacterium]
MTSVLDLWRVLDPAARLISGSTELLTRPVRGVNRTRAGPPHLPTVGDGELLIADSAIVAGASVEALIAAFADADVSPSAVWVADASEADLEPSASPLPVIAGAASASAVAAAASRHLEHGDEELRAISASLRLAAAEAALTDPQPSAPAGVVASRLRRGIAVAVDGGLVALNPRPAGRALATRFAATHARLLADRSAVVAAARRTRDGLWVLERPIDPGATAWLFDDLPLAALDGVGLDALAVTLRALLRRRSPEPARARGLPKGVPSTGDSMHDTLLAVARANGRIAPAARALGVHRNTVLYRIRRGVTELGVDPRRPEDAWRIMRDAQRDESE